jgi:hypothetical protein
VIAAEHGECTRGNSVFSAASLSQTPRSTHPAHDGCIKLIKRPEDIVDEQRGRIDNFSHDSFSGDKETHGDPDQSHARVAIVLPFFARDLGISTIAPRIRPSISGFEQSLSR